MPIIVEVAPTPRQTEKSITQIIVGMERIKENKASMHTPTAFVRKRNDVFSMAIGIAISALKIVERNAKATLIPQERKREVFSIGEGGMI